MRNDRSPLFLQECLAAMCSNFSPFFLNTSLIQCLLDFLQLRAFLPKHSTPEQAQHSTALPAVATAESFSPVFHGKLIVSLPDFNSFRRMMHSVCDSTYCPHSHVSYSCLAIYFHHLFLPTLLVFPTPVSLIFNFLKSSWSTQ